MCVGTEPHIIHYYILTLRIHFKINHWFKGAETEKGVLEWQGYLVEVFTGGSHLLPGLVEQLDGDAEELLEGAIVGEKHGVEVVTVFTGCKQKNTHRCYPHLEPCTCSLEPLGLIWSDMNQWERENQNCVDRIFNIEKNKHFWICFTVWSRGQNWKKKDLSWSPFSSIYLPYFQAKVTEEKFKTQDFRSDLKWLNQKKSQAETQFQILILHFMSALVQVRPQVQGFSRREIQ